MTSDATRRNVLLPDAMWEAVQERAYDLTAKERQTVSASEVIRRAVEAYLKRQRTEGGGK